MYGAIELAARLETLGFSSGGTEPPPTSPRADTILPRSDRAVTLGLNWFPNRWVKIQMNLIHDTIENADRISPALPPSFWSHVFRFQFSL